MLFPIGDTPNPTNYNPWVTWLIMAVNVMIYVFITVPLSRRGISMDDPMLQEYLRAIADHIPPGVSPGQILPRISAYELYTFVHGYKPGAPSITDLFSSMFLHGGFLHLAGNMLFLWIYGDNVEHRLGRTGFLFTYLLTGAVATLFFSLFAGSSMTPLVGASGAISGVLGVYYLLFPRNRVKVFIALIPFYIDVLLIPARIVLGFFIIVDNLLPVLLRQQSSVAYGAHIGGFLGGLAIAMAGERLSWNWPWRDNMWQMASGRPKAAPFPHHDSTNLAELRTALRENTPQDAVEILRRMTPSETAGLSPDECVILSGWLDERGHPIAASKLLRQCLVQKQGTAGLADAFFSLGLMRLRQGQPTAAYQYLLAALENNPSPETERRAREALGLIENRQHGHTLRNP